MDREGFRNRLKQYKLAREENPGLKYYDFMERLAEFKAKEWDDDPDMVLTHMLNDNSYNYKQMYEDNPNYNIEEGHFVDTYKTVYHPTFSEESMYSGKKSQYNPEGVVGGSWDESTKSFYIKDARLSRAKAQNYLNRADPGYKAIPKYDEGTEGVGGKVVPTQEEYIAEQIAAERAAALKKSYDRQYPKVPTSGGKRSKTDWENSLNQLEEYLNTLLSRWGITPSQKTIWLNNLKALQSQREAGYDAYIGEGKILGPSCAYTTGDNYGIDCISSELFRLNHADYGFREIPYSQVQPSDVVLDYNPEEQRATHTMMYSKKGSDGVARFNHSNGGHTAEAIRKDARYPFKGQPLAYEFVGTPADSTQWINDYKKIYGFAEGTDGVLESYYNPTTVKGMLAKTALQLADPTGVSSYPDVWYSGKEFLKSPSWAKLGDVGLNTLSALPLIGKVTAPFKAAKMAKLLTRIEDANALVKGVEKANRLNRAIDTVPELLPVVRRGAEKVQDVTSSLITNPMFNYISNQNKFDLVRNYRNVNAAVDAVNIGNNTADLTQGIGTLIGYGKL